MKLNKAISTGREKAEQYKISYFRKPQSNTETNTRKAIKEQQ